MSQKKRERITLQQVADYAGVSRATASLVVRGSKSISEEKREKVLQAMKELGYVYDRIAANLRSQHSSTVGLIISEIGNPFFSELLVGIHQALDKEGYTIILGTTFDLLNKQDELLSTMLEYRVGGVIISPSPGTPRESIERLEQWGIPVVLVTREPLSTENLDYVGINNVQGAELATQHLIDSGHRRIAFVLGNANSSVRRDRLLGYTNALQEAGIAFDPTLLIEAPISRSGGREAAAKLLALEDAPTAVFCYNDMVAFGVMLGLKEMGIDPGQDLAVVGFDDLQESAMFSPSLTTINAFPKQIGMYASDRLHQRITGTYDDGAKRIILEPELIVRQSSLSSKVKG